MSSNGLNLMEIIEHPKLHKLVLGSYTGAYSLGVTRYPGSKDEYAILLRIEDESPKGFPKEVTFAGHQIPVIVKGSFRVPKALRRKDAA